MANIYDMADTWNDGATTFSAIKMNVTDTASASDSLLMDLQVGGVSKFSVGKNGEIVTSFPLGKTGIRAVGNGHALIASAFGTDQAAYGAYGPRLKSDSTLSWGSTSNGPATADTILARDAAGTLAQRNGVNAQAFRVYGTYTDASNYERGVFAWIGNDLKIGTENAGTGSSARQTHIYGGGQIRLYTGNLLRWYVASGGNFSPGIDNAYDIGDATANRPRNFFQAGYWQTSEMTAPAAPAANGVRIYAEDDGAGKTRLMALFGSGVAQQIAIEP